MRSSVFPLLGAAALGFAAATVCFTASTPRAARAETRPSAGGFQQVPNNFSVAGTGTNFVTPQPLQIQALDPDHFVVASREARLVMPINARDNAAQNMICTVITHYTVRGDRLLPVESVRVPTGFRLVTVEE